MNGLDKILFPFREEVISNGEQVWGGLIMNT